MKFYNKKKEYRNTWTQVEGPAFSHRAEAKRWCQQYGSTGRFYFPELSNVRGFGGFSLKKGRKWYFENPQDALVFALVWSGNIK
jgi:hypothetical protein